MSPTADTRRGVADPRAYYRGAVAGRALYYAVMTVLDLVVTTRRLRALCASA